MARDPLQDIQNRWGPSALKRLGDRGTPLDSGTIPTGYPELDQALGVGGIPRGRIVEAFGAPSSGTLSLALRILAHAQDRGALGGLIDPLQTLDAFYAAQLGVNLDQLVIITPKTPSEAFHISYTLVSTNALAILVMDLAARWTAWNWSHSSMTKGIRRLAGLLSKSNTAFLIVNRAIEGDDSGDSPAGHPLRHFASIRIQVTRTAWLRQGEGIIGCRSEIRVLKNKLAPPYRKAEIDILYQPNQKGHEQTSFL